MFVVNDILRSRSGDGFRVLRLDDSGRLVPYPAAWVFDLDDPLALPRPVELHDLREKLRSGELTVVPVGELQTASKRSDAAKARAEKALKILEDILVYPDIFEPAWRSEHVLAAAERHKCSPQTVMAYLRRYFHGGQTVSALMMAFHRSGPAKSNTSNAAKSGDETIGATANRGAKAQEYPTYQMTKNDHANIKEVAKTALKESMAHAIRSVVIKHYSYVDGNGNSFSRVPGERPSVRQIRSSIQKQFPLEKRLRKKHGDGVFELDHAPTLASAVESVRGIGEVYEIDATIYDCQLVARADRGRTIGKPTGYHIIDRRSQLCVGFYVTLESIAWASAVLAICSLGESKRELCERYGVPYDPKDWPAEGLLPGSFAADRGEMLCRNSDRIPLLGIRVTNNPARMPRRKPFVEASFHLIPQIIRDETPGYEVPNEFRKRTGKKYGQDATLNLDEFIKTMLIGIITYNRRVLLDYPAPTAMKLAGTPITPINVWNWERENGNSHALARFPADNVRQRLLPVEAALVTGSGIEFRGLTYRCPELEKRGAFVQAARSSFEMEASYDSRLVDTIYLHDPKGSAGAFLIATLSREIENYRGLSFPEVKAIQSLSPVQRQDKEQTALDNAVFRNQHLSDMFKKAKKEVKKATAGKPRASRRADMKADRDAEQVARRKEESARAVNKEFPTYRDEAPRPSAPTAPAPQESVPAPPAHPQSLKARLAAARLNVINGK